MTQPTLFDQPQIEIVAAEQIVLFALGEFQARKKELAERELPLDRLKGAFRRAAEHFKTNELSDDALAEELRALGARVVQMPAFRAKHPFRVTVNRNLAENALEFYKQQIEQAGIL